MVEIAEWLDDMASCPQGEWPYGKQNLWVYSDTGFGKTTMCMEIRKRRYCAAACYGEGFMDWLDDRAQCIMFDEFDGDFPFSTFLTITGGGFGTFRVKGSQMLWERRIPTIVCAQHPPAYYYPRVSFSRQQALLRRFKVVQLTQPIKIKFVERDNEENGNE